MSKRYAIKEANTKRLQKVFSKLLKHLPKAYKTIQLGLVFTEMPGYKTYQGGYAVPSTINLGTEFVNTYTSEEGLAEILAHELAHHVLGHMNLKEQIVPLGEQDCDHFALFLCELAGYKRSKIVDHMEKFEKNRSKTLSKEHRDTHGTGLERVEKLKAQDKYLSELEGGL